jgi:hypothetical protein
MIQEADQVMKRQVYLLFVESLTLQGHGISMAMYSGVTPKLAPCAIPGIVPTLLPTLTPSRALENCYLYMKF